jgi:hypothetical protein
LSPDPIYYIKPSAPICTCDAENVFELQNADDQKLTVDDLVDIRKQSAVEEAEEPEPQERHMTVLNLAEGRGHVEAGIRIFEDIDSNDK